MNRWDRLFKDTKLLEYVPPPPWLHGRAEGVSHKRATRTRRRRYGDAEVVMEGTKSGLFSVRVYDWGRGYPKLVGRTSGMGEYEAEALYEDVCNKLREEES